MTALQRGLAVGLIHLAIIGSLGGKLLYDRATRPRVWVETAPYDPDLPIRGRYVSLQVVVDAPGIEPPAADRSWETIPVRLAVEKGRLVAHRDPSPRPYPAAGHAVRFVGPDRSRAALATPVAFFITEHVDDPSRRRAGETLWVEVTLPRLGPPRPIRLGVKRGDALEPLALD
jgi:hypothetical protein